MGWFRRTTAEPAAPRVQLIDRAGCHLCDEAAAVLERVVGPVGEAWTRVDVDGSAELLEQYADLVPVVLVDGQSVAQWRVSEAQLTAALRRRPPRTRR